MGQYSEMGVSPYFPAFPSEEEKASVGPYVIAAILRGIPHAALRHRLKQIEGTAWGHIAKHVSASANGHGGERLFNAFNGVRIAGHTEEETRRLMLGLICNRDAQVEQWLKNDPEFKRREEMPRRTLADVIGMFDAIEWIWENYIPTGFLSMFAGVPGTGKSWVAQWIATNLLIGSGEFPDGSLCPDFKAPIIWVDVEGTERLFGIRARSLGMEAVADRVIHLVDPKHPDVQCPLVDLSKDHWAGILMDTCLREGAKWVIIDALRGAHTTDENASEIQGMLQNAAAIARDANTALTFIHHLRKKRPGENELTMEMVRGSSAIVAMMRVLVGFDKPNPLTEEVRMRILKSNLGLMPQPIGVQITGEGPQRLDHTPGPPKKISRIDLAIEFLQIELDAGPVPSQDIFAKAVEKGISKASLTRARYQIGIIPIKAENGVWSWSLPTKRDENDVPF